MWLRDHCYAFHHLSRNLKNIEQSISIHGSSVPSSMLGKYVIGCYCNTCGKTWNEWRQAVTNCPSCTSTAIINSIFADVDQYKNTAVKIPRPSKENLEWAKSFIKPNTVGIFARGRKTYGRNLPKEYYVQLIHKLQSQGYNIVWLGEKQSTQPCPVEGIFDFSRENESRDLEKTLAIICHLEFTIQFWTASSRLAALMGVPYILFESPDQIFTSGILPGQEGRRLELLTFGPKKIVLSDFLNVLDDFDGTLNLLDQAILELKNKNYDHLIGMVDYPDIVRKMADE
jgi:ADP-heptose:LPS heptosyltransferase